MLSASSRPFGAVASMGRIARSRSSGTRAASSTSTRAGAENPRTVASSPGRETILEPFAKAAFNLQEGQISDVVETEYGCHLILVTARMPGKDVKFEEVKEDVRAVMADRFRDELIAELRKTAKIEIATPAAPPK